LEGEVPFPVPMGVWDQEEVGCGGHNVIRDPRASYHRPLVTSPGRFTASITNIGDKPHPSKANG
jgi:hypothetical protein